MRRARRSVVTLTAVSLLLSLTPVLPALATAPTWEGGAELTITILDETTVTVSWPAAIDSDEDAEVVGYLVSLDGDPVENGELIDGFEYGFADLDPTEIYSVSVWAVDENDDESAPLEAEFVTGPGPTWPDPAEVVYTYIDATTGQFTWDPAEGSLPIVEYKVSLNGSNIGPVEPNGPPVTFEYNELVLDEDYDLEVIAVDTFGRESEPLPLSFTHQAPPDPLAFPDGAQVHYSQTTATTGTVSWTPAIGGTGTITYTITVNGVAAGTATHPQTSLGVTGLVGGQTYSFSVFASDSLDTTEPLLPIERTQAAFPQWPGTAEFKVSGISQASATFSWTGALQGSAPLAQYQVSLERETSPGSNTWGPPTDNFVSSAVGSHLFTGLNAGIRYRARVTAFNQDGWSSPPSPFVIFTTRVPGSSGIAVGDEIMFYRNDGTYRVFETLANGSLGATLFSAQFSETPWTSVKKLDLDGDGKDEVLFYRANGTYKYQRMNADGTLGAVMRQGSDYTKNWTSITAVDLDGDGIDELMFYRADGLFRFYKVRPDATVGSPLAAGTNFTKNWTSIDSVDLDGNGRDELFFYRADGLYRFYRPRPDGSLPSAMAQGSDYTKNWTSISGVDVNADGRDEMVFYRADGLYRVYRPNPDGSLPGPLQAGTNYETGWTSITGVNVDAK